MNFNLAAAAVFTGAGAFTAYSGIKEGCKQQPNERSKGWEMVKVATGVALIALGVMHGIKSQVALEVVHEIKSYEFNPTKCDIPHLNSLLKAGNSEDGLSMSTKLFSILKANQGINCNNYLPWNLEFSQYKFNEPTPIDNIKPEDLKQSVMWGVDQFERPFIAIKHTCDQVTEKVTSLYQGTPDNANYWSKHEVEHEYLNEISSEDFAFCFAPLSDSYAFWKDKNFNLLRDLLTTGSITWKFSDFYVPFDTDPEYVTTSLI